MGRDNYTTDDQQPPAAVCGFFKQFWPEHHRIHYRHSIGHGAVNT